MQRVYLHYGMAAASVLLPFVCPAGRQIRSYSSPPLSAVITATQVAGQRSEAQRKQRGDAHFLFTDGCGRPPPPVAPVLQIQQRARPLG